VVLSAGTALVCLLAGFSTEESMLRAVTVMVISCPCALGIATLGLAVSVNDWPQYDTLYSGKWAHPETQKDIPELTG